MKLENLDTPPLIRALFYGDSGSGKTTLIGTAMECETTFPLLVLNARGQPISLRSLDPRPLVLTVEKMADLNPVYTWILRGQPRPDAAPNPTTVFPTLFNYLDSIQQPRFGSLAVDSLTHLQRIAMGGLAGDPGNPGDVPPQAQIQHWGRALAMMTNMADKFFQLPIHVFMTALTRHETIEALSMVMHAPFLWGQSSFELPSHAEIVGRLCATTTISPKDQRAVKDAFDKRGAGAPFNLLYLAGGRDFIAKWQGVQNPPAAMPGPTIAKILRHLNGKSEQGQA